MTDADSDTVRWGHPTTDEDTGHRHSRVHGNVRLFESVWLFAPPTEATHFHADRDCDRQQQRCRTVSHREIDHQQLRPCPWCHDNEWVVMGKSNSETYHTDLCGDWPRPANRAWIRVTDVKKRRIRECKQCSEEYDEPPGRADDCPLCDAEFASKLSTHIQREHGVTE